MSKVMEIDACKMDDFNHVFTGLKKREHKHVKVKKIISNGGNFFRLKKMRDWCTRKRVGHMFTLAYDHCGNKLSERCNTTLSQLVKR